MCIMRIMEEESNPSKAWAWVFLHSQPSGGGGMGKLAQGVLFMRPHPWFLKVSPRNRRTQFSVIETNRGCQNVKYFNDISFRPDPVDLSKQDNETVSKMLPT